MIVAIDAQGQISLEEPQVFNALHILMNNGFSNLDGLEDLRADPGQGDGADHAWMRVEALRALGPADPAWAEKFDAMVSYAKTKGWVRGAPQEVRLHIVRA